MLSEADPPSWPDWLLEPLLRPAEPPGQRVGRGWGVEQQIDRPYALAALRGAVQRVASAVPGTRNSTLNAECFALCRFTPVHLTSSEIAHSLAAAAHVAGLTATETERTITSALRAGGAA